MADTNKETSAMETLSEEQLSALIQKYRPEINQVLALDTEAQKKEIARYGLSPEAIMEHYRGLQAKSAELEYKSAAVNSRSIIAGIASFLATAGVFLAAGKRLSSNALVRWSVAVVTSITAGLGGGYIAMRLLGQKVREESRMLSTVARDVFERELAVAMEEVSRHPVMQNASSDATAVLQEPDTKEDKFSDSAPQKSAIVPRESFTAEAAKEKAAAQGAEAQL